MEMEEDKIKSKRNLPAAGTQELVVSIKGLKKSFGEKDVLKKT